MFSIKALLILLAGLVLTCLAQNANSQQPSPQKPDDEDVIRIKTDLVQVRAVVTDRKGQLIDNLKQEDFEILENGVPQHVSFFTLERILSGAPVPAADRANATIPDQTKEPAAAQRPGRSIVLFVDTLHLSAISLVRAKQQLKQFVDQHITDQDLVAIVTTSNSLGVLQQFMRDRRMLKYAIDKISLFPRLASFFTPYLAARVRNDDQEALSLATQLMAKEEYGGTMAPPPGTVRGRAKQILGEETVLRRATLQTLKAVSERMSDLPGQRMIAFMSEGFTLLDEGASERDDFTAATSRAARSGVIIYSFSPQGLTVPVEFTAAAPIGGILFSSYMTQTRMDQQDLLRNLAADTGGQAYINSNDVVGQFKKMLDSNSLYYAFGYYPQDTTAKKFRNLKVRVRNHPEYNVRTQRGYQPAKDAAQEVATTPQEKLFQAMISPLPLTTLGVTTAASFLERADDDAQITLQVHLDGKLLQYPMEDQKYLLHCEAAVVIFDHQGKVSTSFADPITAALTSEQLEKGKQNGYRYNKRLKILPGLYQIRLGVRDVNGGLMGTSMSWVTVPDLHNNKLTLSGVFLGKGRAEDPSPTVSATEQQSSAPRLIPGPASFKSRESIFYRFVLYNAPSDTQLSSDMTIKVEVLQGGAVVYAGNWGPISPRIVRSDQTGIELGGQIRMDMAAGIYTLRVTVKDAKSNHTAEQSIDLELEA